MLDQWEDAGDGTSRDGFVRALGLRFGSTEDAGRALGAALTSKSRKSLGVTHSNGEDAGDFLEQLDQELTALLLDQSWRTATEAMDLLDVPLAFVEGWMRGRLLAYHQSLRGTR
jgi:hypothetical protein